MNHPGISNGNNDKDLCVFDDDEDLPPLGLFYSCFPWLLNLWLSKTRRPFTKEETTKPRNLPNSLKEASYAHAE